MISFWSRKKYKNWLCSVFHSAPGIQEDAPLPVMSRLFSHFLIKKNFYWGIMDKTVLTLCTWTAILLWWRQSSWKVNQEIERELETWTTYLQWGTGVNVAVTSGKMRQGSVRMGRGHRHRGVFDSELAEKMKGQGREWGGMGGGGAKRIWKEE